MRAPNTADVDTCALCPRLCRSACPVASGTGREAAVPAVIAGVIRDWRLGRVDPEVARQASTLCTDCGACQQTCHLDRPLPAALRRVRAELVPPPPIEPIRRLEGKGTWVAVETDARRWSTALARYLGTPVRRWYTADHWGVGAIEHSVWQPQSEALRSASEGLTLVIADGGLSEGLQQANLDFRWLHDVCPELRRAAPGCRDAVATTEFQGRASEVVRISCCGGAGPLNAHHPDDARRMGARWLRDRNFKGPTPFDVRDSRCGHHLREGGATVRDSVDLLLEKYG